MIKSILAISGSASNNSSNKQLLECFKASFSDDYSIDVVDGLASFPLFSPQLLEAGIPENVKEFKSKVSSAEAVIISTPEYLHNIPAVLKNALEWMTASGELYEKSVLAITFTPAPPRGEFAMNSLLQSLKTSKAKVLAEIPLYRNNLVKSEQKFFLSPGIAKFLKEFLA
ncbi:NAD(P)H-dependent oxidoreductase [Flavobacteriales bacterium]|nr:NAD(P)H-dependent oxidoreductase [Flavobacteriales bacterium]